METDRAGVTLAVLAGGQSRRMGRPKTQLRLGGRPILEFLLEQFDWPGPTLLVTGPGLERPPGADGFDAEASDPVADQGPMRGLLTALERAATPTVVVVTVDMPGVGGLQLEWLLDRLGERPQRLGVMSRHGDRVEPFPIALRREAGAVVMGRFAAGERSVRALGELGEFVVEAAPSDWPGGVWTNLNTLGDYEAFAASLG